MAHAGKKQWSCRAENFAFFIKKTSKRPLASALPQSLAEFSPRAKLNPFFMGMWGVCHNRIDKWHNVGHVRALTGIDRGEYQEMTRMTKKCQGKWQDVEWKSLKMPKTKGLKGVKVWYVVLRNNVLLCYTRPSNTLRNNVLLQWQSFIFCII